MTTTTEGAYRQLIASFQAGSMSQTQLERHMAADQGFAKYVRDIERARLAAWRS